MTTDSEETSQRPLILILGGLAVLLVLIVGGVVAYFALRQSNTPAPAPDYVAQTACDHPYFPLRPGATWRYAGDVLIGENSIPATALWRVEQVFGDETQATAIVIVIHLFNTNEAQVTETIAFTCTPTGIVRDSLIAVSDVQSVSKYSLLSGTYLLPPEQLIPGASWDYLYNTITNYAPPGTDYTWSYQATDIETIDHDTGTFDAIRVEGERSAPDDSDSSTEWFTFGVGQVRSERVQSDGGVDVVSTMMLTSYDVPE